MFKLMLVVLAILAVASAQVVTTGFAYPYGYGGLYRSGAVGYTGAYSYPYGYRSAYYGGYYY